jgi:hypothetical protein
MIVNANAQPFAKVMPKRQAKLLAGLHQSEHAVARQPAIAADRPARDFPLDDKPTQISLRRIGVEGDFRPLENPEQLRLATPQPNQQFVEITVTGADRKNPVEARLQALGHGWVRPSSIGFESLVKVPNQLAHGLDVLHLAGCSRHQFLQEPFGMDPTQGMSADTKLPGIVGDDHRVSNEAMMANGTPYAGLCKWPKRFRVEDVDTMLGEMLEEGHLIGKPQWFMGVQPGSKGRVDLPVFQQRESGVVENIVLVVAAQQGEEVQPRLRGRRAKGCEMLAADVRCMKIAVGVTGAGVVDRHIGRRYKASMQHGGILGMKAIQPLGKEPYDLTFGNLDTDIVEQGRQPLRRDLAIRMQHQAEASQVSAIASLNSWWQRRGDRLPLRRHPAFPPVTNNLDLQNQIPDEAVLVPFEARSGRYTGRQHLFTRHPLRVVLRPSRAGGRILSSGRLVTRCFFHARRSEGWAGRQVFKPRNLVAQKLVIEFQPVVLDFKSVVLVEKLLVFSFELLNSGVCPISTLHQTGHKLTQRLQRQRIGMLDHRQAALRHKGIES